MSVGAQSNNVMALILYDGLTSTIPGVIAGGFLSVLSTRLFEGLLYGVKPLAPMTFALCSAFVIICGAGAAAIPAMRLAWRNPAELLRASTSL